MLLVALLFWPIVATQTTSHDERVADALSLERNMHWMQIVTCVGRCTLRLHSTVHPDDIWHELVRRKSHAAL